MDEPSIDIPRRDNDTKKSYAALCDYCRMGPNRSLAKLHQHYTNTSPENAVTTSLRWLKEWSRKHDWQDRVRTYDEKVQAWKEEEARKTMREGLALPRERVDKLKGLFDRLEGELEDGALWLEDVKAIGSNEHGTFREVEIQRFNSAILKHLRGILDDLAQETGGRKQRMDVTTDDEPITDINVTIVAGREGRITEDG